MDAQRWQWIESLFHEAAAQPEAARHTFLAAACAGDPEALNEILSLLEEDLRKTSLLDRDIGQVARSFIGNAPSRPALCAVGPYRIVRLLGEGGMGVVYLAKREDLGSEVAIKILPNAWMSPARRERFALEQRTQSRLNHPSIARLYDAGALDDGTPWFAMEYVEGRPFIDYCENSGAALDQRLRLFRSVCEAVQYAHRQAILHRDLKPSNILVKADGAIRLLDFGIAKHLDPMEGAIDLTRTGLGLATPAYAAPEQIRGEAAAIQADVYSLGVILYELLAGRLPFDLSGRTPGEAIAAIETQQPEGPSLAARRMLGESKAVWFDLDVLCLTAIHKDTRRRYQSVEAFIRDIDHFLKNEPLEARPDDFRYKFGKFVRRNRRSLAAAALVLAALACMAVYFTLRLAAARDSALAEAARTQRIQRFMMQLFEGGDASAGPAEDLRVVTLVDRSAREARALSADPAVQADLYQTLGKIYLNLGKFDRAGDLLQAALDHARSHPNESNSHLSEDLLAMGLLRLNQGKLDEAESLVRRSLDHAGGTLPPAHPLIAEATSALGRVFMERGQYQKAIQTLEQAVQLQTPASAPTQDMAIALNRLADAHFYAGHYDESESLNRRVLDMYRRIYGQSHPKVADPLINLGAIAQQRAHFTEAERLYRQAYDINRAYYGSSHPETAASLMGIGRALVFQKRPDEAQSVLEEVLAVRERVYGPVHPNVASTLSSLGGVAIERGQLDLAENCYRRMAQIYRTVNGDRHHFVALALSNLGAVYVERKDYIQAEKILRDVVQRYSEVLPADHLDVGVGRVRLGRALLGQARYREAEEQSLGGLRILEKKTSPSSPWIQSARKDLAATYEALGQPEKAREFRGGAAR